MERRAAALVLLLAIAGVPAFTGSVSAQDGAPKDGGPYRVVLSAGEAFDMCRSGEIVCPAKVPICDDPGVAVPVDLPGGMGFRAVSPGTTLCSAASAIGPRRVFRITVR
jgi:hypothetical protein